MAPRHIATALASVEQQRQGGGPRVGCQAGARPRERGNISSIASHVRAAIGFESLGALDSPSVGSSAQIAKRRPQTRFIAPQRFLRKTAPQADGVAPFAVTIACHMLALRLHQRAFSPCFDAGSASRMFAAGLRWRLGGQIGEGRFEPKVEANGRGDTCPPGFVFFADLDRLLAFRSPPRIGAHELWRPRQAPASSTFLWPGRRT